MHLLNIMIIKNEEAREDACDDFKWNHQFLNLGNVFTTRKKSATLEKALFIPLQSKKGLMLHIMCSCIHYYSSLLFSSVHQASK